MHMHIMFSNECIYLFQSIYPLIYNMEYNYKKMSMFNRLIYQFQLIFDQYFILWIKIIDTLIMLIIF